MKVKSYVLEDKPGQYTTKDNKTVETRTLICVDLDEANRLESSFGVRIPLDSPLSGNPDAPSLRDHTVELAITRISQFEKTKVINLDGIVLKVLGKGVK